MKLGALSFLLATVAAASSSLSSDAPKEARESKALARPISYLKCNACHSTEPGVNGVGPTLAGLNGRKAGSLPGFAYTDALKATGITWDVASLEKWLAAPQEAVPGMCLPFNGFADPARRKEMADYLLSL